MKNFDRSLMIGNYVKYKGQEIKCSLFFLPISYEAIPLTDEWYERFGFVWSQKRCTWTKGDFQLLHWNDELMYVNSNCDYSFDDDDKPNSSYTRIPALKYVHKLQNLYFELKGEELTESKKK